MYVTETKDAITNGQLKDAGKTDNKTHDDFFLQKIKIPNSSTKHQINRNKIDYTNRQIHARTFSWDGTGI